MTKPFGLEELAARVRTVLRRTRPEATGPVLTFTDIRLDQETYEVRRSGHLIELSPTEFRLLRYLMLNPGRALTRAQLLDHAPQGRGLARIEASVSEREASQELMRRFLAEASHELRTPLASLRANAELYTQGALTERSQVDEKMRRIMLESQRMSRLVDDMLRLARLDQHPARQRDPVDVSTLAAGCVERSRIADPRRTWQARIAPGLVAIGDEELLRRAVDNLLANVHAHTPEGTTAVITADEDGDRVVVEVSDNGPGVPADRLPRIFDRFYRAGTAAQRPGSGLGLAIVTEIAAAHDGTVTAAAVWPRGLRVTLAVPAWRSADSMGAPGDQFEPADCLGRHHHDDGAPDPDLVAFLQPLGDDDAAPVEPGAVGRAEVLDVPEAVSRLEEGMMAGGVLVVDNQGALSAGGELGVEDAGLVPGLDDD
jgi:signal transduction histidine kinase